jgi:hypothetical protein
MPNVHAAARATTLHTAAAQTIGDCQPRPNRHENEEVAARHALDGKTFLDPLLQLCRR